MPPEDEERECAWKKFDDAEEALDAYMHGSVYDSEHLTELTDAVFAAKDELRDLITRYSRKKWGALMHTAHVVFFLICFAAFMTYIIRLLHGRGR